jgi:hypothetical protein
MSNDVLRMNRAISGDIAESVKELTGIDLRMVKDPETLLLIMDLKKMAKAKGMNDIIPMLDQDEKIERAYQYIQWQKDIREDISKLGLASGNKNIEDGFDEGYS